MQGPTPEGPSAGPAQETRVSGVIAWSFTHLNGSKHRPQWGRRISGGRASVRGVVWKGVVPVRAVVWKGVVEGYDICMQMGPHDIVCMANQVMVC